MIEKNYRMIAMTTEARASARRERARLRSERWRRTHGIPARKPASKPWLAEGVSRSTWYRRGNRIGAAFAANGAPDSDEQDDERRRCCGKCRKCGTLDRAELSLARLSRELIAAAGHMAVAGSILREFPAAVR
jgi:hypothetical protein